MSDVRTRALERAAEIDPAVRPVLEAAKLRDGSAVHGPHLPPPSTTWGGSCRLD